MDGKMKYMKMIQMLGIQNIKTCDMRHKKKRDIIEKMQLPVKL